MYIKTLTVSKLNNYIKKIMDNDFILRNIYVKGEISNLKIHNSGHIYFSLKDSEGKINCVMFRGEVEELDFIPENGTDVLVKGRVSVYVKDGSYQLYCSEIKREGLGELYIAFENLKKRLLEEGIFDEEHKKQLPRYPKKIGIITSPTGAAIRDIINVVSRRNPKVDMIIYPSLVQGERASADVINGLNYFEGRKDIDVIIIARGGGSLEELWTFNDEKLAYTIYKCNKPVVSGIGHETDFTIADFVSDKRVPTPSAAAEIVVPRIEQMKEELNIFNNYLSEYMENFIAQGYNKIDIFKKTLDINSPLNSVVNSYSVIDNYKTILDSRLKGIVSLEKEKLGSFKALLYSNNPLNLLDKGYAILEDNEKNIIRNIENLKTIEVINVKLSNGEAKFKINFLEDNNG